MRLLLAEDEADLAEALGVFFEKNHFSYPRTGISTICSTSSAKGRTPARLPGSRSPARTRCGPCSSRRSRRCNRRASPIGRSFWRISNS